LIFRSKPKSFQLQPVIEGCIQRKAASQRALLEQFYGLAKKICLRYASGNAEAEEMVDDGFLKIFERIGEYDLSRPFEPWLSRIMVNTAIDYFRKYGHRIAASDLEEAVEVSTDANQISMLAAEELLSLIQQLPATYRLVFNLCALEGYDHAFVADQLGITESTSRANLAKARAKLQLWVHQLTAQPFNQSNRHVIAKF